VNEDDSGETDHCVSHGEADDRYVLGSAQPAVGDRRRYRKQIAELYEEDVKEYDEE